MQFAASGIDFTPSVQRTIMFVLSAYFSLIQYTQRCEIYSSERPINANHFVFFSNLNLCFTNFALAMMIIVLQKAIALKMAARNLLPECIVFF